MASCLGKSWGFGLVVVFAIGHRQEKGITATPSPQRGLACPRPWALPSLLQPQKPIAKSHRRCQLPAPAHGGNGQHQPLGHHAGTHTVPPRGVPPPRLPHWASRNQAGHWPQTHEAPILPAVAAVKKKSGLRPLRDKIASNLEPPQRRVRLSRK